jgi:hypothetical protein
MKIILNVIEDKPAVCVYCSDFSTIVLSFRYPSFSLPANKKGLDFINQAIITKSLYLESGRNWIIKIKARKTQFCHFKGTVQQ